MKSARKPFSMRKRMRINMLGVRRIEVLREGGVRGEHACHAE
jgi:hypothetical protein